MSSNWRSVIGPKGLTRAQVEFWDNFFSGMAGSAAWKQILEQNQWEGEYRSSADALKFFEDEYKHLKALPAETGDAKAVR